MFMMNNTRAISYNSTKFEMPGVYHIPQPNNPIHIMSDTKLTQPRQEPATDVKGEPSGFHMIDPKYRGVVVSSDEISRVPTRYDSLCRDNPDTKDVEQSIRDNQDIMFMPADTRDYHMYVNREQRYFTQIFGCLKNGDRACVLLTMNPYFDIELPADEDHDKISTHITSQLRGTRKQFDIEIVRNRKYMGYHRHRTNFLRVSCKSLIDRNILVKFCRTNIRRPMSTTYGSRQFHLAMSAYMRKYYAGWCVLKKYRSHTAIHSNIKCNNTFVVDLEDYCRYDGDIFADDSLKRDKAVLLTWDIETAKSPHRKDGKVPLPEDDDSRIFQISMVANTVHNPNAYLNILITNIPQDPDPDTLVIKCKDEADIITTFANVFERINPDYINAFNSGSYDWPWIHRRAIKHDIFDHVASKLSSVVFRPGRKTQNAFRSQLIYDYYRRRPVKIDADKKNDMTCYGYEFPGYVNVDLMPWLRKENAKKCDTANSYSLNFFLGMFGERSKDDMNFRDMFQAVHDIDQLVAHGEQPTPELMALSAKIGRYCSRDALQTARLLIKRNGIPDMREVACMTHTTMTDAIWLAGGMKVKQLIIAVGTEMGFAFDTTAENKIDDRYAGAYVFDPDKGLAAAKASIDERVFAANDTERKYSNVPDAWADVTPEDAEAMKGCVRDGLNTPDEYYPKLREAVRPLMDEFIQDKQNHPVYALDYQSLYPSIIIAYNIDPSTTITDKIFARKLIKAGVDLHHQVINYAGRRLDAWFKRHDGTEETMAIGPRILKKLFAERAQLKKQLEPLTHYIELHDKGLFDQARVEYPEYNERSIDDIRLYANYLDAKQKARKVFMNTFYGIMGYDKTPFFCLETAASVTSIGQMLIKKAYSIVVDQLGHRVVYGDTDSLYSMLRHDLFTDLDRQYYGGLISKTEYYTKSVQLTMNKAHEIREAVNREIAKFVGNGTLRMAFEEVLWPAAFLCKKVYFGIKHEKEIGFDVTSAKNLFRRGVSSLKRDTIKMKAKMTDEAMLEIVNINNIREPMDVVLDKLRGVRQRKWEIQDFAKPYRWKSSDPNNPRSGNQTVKAFIQMRRDLGLPIPIQLGDRFTAAVTNQYPWTYNMRGNQRELKVGERLRFIDEIKSIDEIDMNHSIESLCGQYAQFLTYRSEFIVDAVDNTDKALRDAFKATVTKAKSYLIGYDRNIGPRPVNKGPAYKKVFNLVSKQHNNRIARRLNCKQSDIMYRSVMGDDTAELRNRIVDGAKENADKKVIARIDTAVDMLMEGHEPAYIHTLRMLYNNTAESVYKNTVKVHDMQMRELMLELDRKIAGYKRMFDVRNDIYDRYVGEALDVLGLRDLIPYSADEVTTPTAANIKTVIDSIDDEATDGLDPDVLSDLVDYRDRLSMLFVNIAYNDAVSKEIEYRSSKLTRSGSVTAPIVPPTMNRDDELATIKMYAAQLGDVFAF